MSLPPQEAARATTQNEGAPPQKKAPRRPPQEIIDAAQETQRETGVPASATLGQWALESGFGAHSPGNNPFGIKALKGQPSQMLWTKEKAKNGSGLVRVKQPFRVFDSLEDAFRARGQLLSRHYPLAMAHTDDPDAFVQGLQADPNHQYAGVDGYADSVIKTMKQYDFYQYDLPDPLTKKNNDASVRLIDGEHSVTLGTDQHIAARIESPHTGGGKVVVASNTVFLGKQQLGFARYGDTTNDNYQVVSDVQDDVLVG